MTDFVHDPARAADASHDGDCPDCPMAPNALVSVQGGPGALARRTFLTRTMLGAAALALAAYGVRVGPSTQAAPASSARVTGRSSTSRGSGWVASRRRTCGRTRRRSTPVPGRS